MKDVERFRQEISLRRHGILLRFTIPGVGERTLEHLVLDLNGTLTTDGQLIPGVKWRISKLRDYLAIYLLTADTFGRGAVIA